MMKTNDFKNEENSELCSDKFLKVMPKCKLFVRLIGQPIKIIRICTHDRKYANIDNEDVGILLRNKFPKQLSRVFVRYACWCIDRVDKTLKILDMPESVASTFGDRVAIVGKKIADISEGCDWAITTNGKKGMYVRYNTIYLKESPLTKSEIRMIEELKLEINGEYDLAKIFKSLNYKDAEAKLFGI